MEDLYDQIVESLRDWFKKSKSKDGKPGWVQVVSGKPCARQPGQKTTPKCVSSAKRASMTKKERESAQRRKRAADPGQPKKSGAAKPTYVSTDKKKKKKSKKNEDLYMSLDKIIPEELEAVLDEKKKRKKKKKKKSGKKDACYHKVKSRYKVWPSAYASGALVKCRKVGAKNWGKSKKENLEIMIEDELSQVLLETHSAKHEKELEKISDELAGASKMHKGQSDRIKKILDQTEDPKEGKVNEETELYEMKNCGCGQDPCKTYGDENEKIMIAIKEETESIISEKKKKKSAKDRMKCNSPRRIRKGEAGHGKKKFVVKACDGGTEKIIRYGDANMEIKKDSPARRKSFRARHNCKNPGSKLKARYWSCKKW